MQRFQWGEDGQRRLVGAGGGGTLFSGTDDRGEVRIFGLMPGEYVIGTRRGLTSGPGAGSDAAEGFANTFYPGTLSATDAQPISVGIGQELSIQFALVASRLSRIRGTATDSQGRPAAGATINLVTQIGCGGMSSSTAGTVGPDGAFSVSGVPPGEHFLQFRQRLGLETESASMPISVAGDINGAGRDPWVGYHGGGPCGL